MDIACVTGARQLADRIAHDLATLGHTVTAYDSMAALTRNIETTAHEVLLLAGPLDLIQAYIACERCRNPTGQAMFIWLSDRDDTGATDSVIASGVDDYVSLSGGLSQLGLRIQLAMRRRRPTSEQDLAILGGLRLDRRDGSAFFNDVSVLLTRREFMVAWALASNSGRVVTVQTLADVIWGTTADIAKRSIEQHVYRLRNKLALAENSTLRLVSVYGKGYLLDLAVEMVRPETQSAYRRRWSDGSSST